MDLVKLGNCLKALRREKGLTQEQLAEKLGVTNRSVSRWETGKNLPDIDVLIMLSGLYGVEVGALLQGSTGGAEGAGAEGGEAGPEEETAALIRAAEYGEAKEKASARAVFLTAVSGAAALGALLFAAFRLLNNVRGGGFFIFASVLAFSLYCILMQAPQRNRSAFGYLAALSSGFLSVAVGNAAVLLLFFASGEYVNRGVAGFWSALLIQIAVFVVAGLVTGALIRARQPRR